MRFVVNLARWLNLSVVAEGVETRAQLERLREVGCDFVQGYFLSKPLPVRDFEALLQNQANQPVETEFPRREEPGLKTLLVVDADDDYRSRVSRAFEGMYQVEEAVDAESGFNCVQKHGKDALAAVILSMDLPQDGAAAFLRLLRADPVLWRVPVLSALPPHMVSDEVVEKLDTDDFLCKNHPMCDMRRRASRMIGVCDCRQKARQLEDEACQDFLTKLYNRRGLDSAVAGLRQADMPVAVYLFDLDNLKQINDQMGHDAGDAMLRSFAEVLGRSTRNTDILCRFGGDEFAVILRRIGSKETVLKKGEAICREFHAVQLRNGIQTSCSCGIAMSNQEELAFAQLLEQADKALYRAKQEGKGTCRLWEVEE